jgi:hypothetical protein
MLRLRSERKDNLEPTESRVHEQTHIILRIAL